jgi:hypothetical protein
MALQMFPTAYHRTVALCKYFKYQIFRFMRSTLHDFPAFEQLSAKTS